MLQKHTFRDLTWIDLESPTREEILSLIEEYDLDPLIGDELFTPSQRSRVDLYEDYIYLVLHFPGISHHKATRAQEVDFIIGKKFIITTRYEEIDPLHKFSKVFEVNSILNKSDMGDHAGYIFFHMIRQIYRDSVLELDYIKGELHDIEEKIFSGSEREMVIEISKTNRILLSFKEAISIHKEVLDSFESAGKKFFGEGFTYHISNIIGEYNKVQTSVQSSREYLAELRGTNDSLLTTKQNETMRIFTVMAFVTFPLALLIDILNFDSIYNPIKGMENDFWIVLFIVGITSLIMYIFFKLKKWL